MLRTTACALATLCAAVSGCSDPAGGGSEGLTFGGSDSATSTSAGSASSGGSASATSSSGSGSASAGSSGASTGGGPKFDVGGGSGAATTGDGCQQQCGFSDWSYVWLANSGEHTISKINTRTMTEEGRFQTRPTPNGNPSRTSVSIDGKAVVVANRAGGVTKYWQRSEFCTDKNGNGTIDTSTGKTDVRAFADEECVAWHTAFPAATTQRPVAWTPGTYNPTTCQYDDQKVWSAAANGTPGATWPCDGADGIHVYLLDGDDGTVEEDIHMPDVSCGGTFGPYGGAVDNVGNLWMYVWSAYTIVHVELATLQYSQISGGSYGITVDTKGRVWVGDSPQRYDPMTMAWSSSMLPGSGGTGIAQDLQNRIWAGTQGGVGWVDMETMATGDTVPLPEGNTIYRGIGVDIDGFIWAVPLGGMTAHRIDPNTYAVETYTGLNSPYTYSDFAGGQISNVTCNPPQG